MVTRRIFEGVAIVLALVGAIADIHERRNEAVILELSAFTTALMSLWSPGASLMGLPSLRRD